MKKLVLLLTLMCGSISASADYGVCVNKPNNLGDLKNGEGLAIVLSNGSKILIVKEGPNPWFHIEQEMCLSGADEKQLLLHVENRSNRYSSLDILFPRTGMEKVSLDDVSDKCKNKYKDYLMVYLDLYPKPVYFYYYCDWAYNRPNRPYTPDEVLGVGVHK